MRKFLLPFQIVAILSCGQTDKPKVDLDEIKKELIQTDLSFSSLSEKEGMHAAFLAYMDDSVTMLRPNSMPLIGKETIQKIYESRPDTGFILTWQPLYADAAQSGELGYTYGTWNLSGKDSQPQRGTYCTVWKRNEKGEWRFVLDTGNEGLAPPQNENH